MFKLQPQHLTSISLKNVAPDLLGQDADNRTREKEHGRNNEKRTQLLPRWNIGRDYSELRKNPYRTSAIPKKEPTPERTPVAMDMFKTPTKKMRLLLPERNCSNFHSESLEP
jgi:hypothetical protein